MGRSFYSGSYTQLYNGTLGFSTKISATPTAYGLTSTQATAYAALSATYVTNYQAVTNKDGRSPSMTAARNSSAIPLKAMAVDLASIINGTPSVTDAQKLDLGLSVRANPSPVNTLGQPNKQKVELNLDGSILIKWQCSSPRASGVVYEVYRKLDSDAAYVYQGGTGEKKWTDATIPGGTTQAMYKIQAVRSTATGPWALFTVTFGQSSSGAVTASVTKAA